MGTTEQQFIVTKSVKLQKGNKINIEVSWKLSNNIIFSTKALKSIAIGSFESYMTAIQGFERHEGE